MMRRGKMFAAGLLFVLLAGCSFAGSVGSMRLGISAGGPLERPTLAGAAIPNTVSAGDDNTEPVLFVELSSPELRVRGGISGRAAAREFDSAAAWLWTKLTALGASLGL